MRLSALRTRLVTVLALLSLPIAVFVAPSNAANGQQGEQTTYLVLAKEGVSHNSASTAIQAAGGNITERLPEIGLYTVTGPAHGFIQQTHSSPALLGAMRDQPIGKVPSSFRNETLAKELQTESGTAQGTAITPKQTTGLEPLEHLQWGQRMVEADKARTVQPGDRRVTVGMIDTGVDATHPDLAPNFDAKLSRNFAPDMPDLDGPCEVPSCLDPVGTDPFGHGTHVAGIAAAAVNNFGVAGVAPNVKLVQVRAIQDSGIVLPVPVLKALVYAGVAQLDVVNMAFNLSPFLYYCLFHPTDSLEDQLEQLVTLTAINRALDFAHGRGVTLVASLGNMHEDLGFPRDDNGRQFPFGQEHPREIDNGTCFQLPTEGHHVIGVSGVGPSQKKADYSNYGKERTALAGAGGWTLDFFGTPEFNRPANRILSTVPLEFLKEIGAVDDNGNIVTGFEDRVFKECAADGRCGYYLYAQGTSMAVPQVTGVAALIVSRLGKDVSPDRVQQVLFQTANQHACPEPRLQTYTNEGRDAEWNAFCEGDAALNGFYGHGIVNANRAVTQPVL